MNREQIEKKVKEIIVNRLNLQIKPEEIVSDAPIFLGSEVEGGKKGLGLDSVDALELVVGLNNDFGVTITDEDMYIFESVDKITDFILEKTK
ncbi:MAG: acyl carrier protein [Firmicutes bacterium]|nr:acyl carrier protein [Bacillota bacterium]